LYANIKINIINYDIFAPYIIQLTIHKQSSTYIEDEKMSELFKKQNPFYSRSLQNASYMGTLFYHTTIASHFLSTRLTYKTST